MLRRRSARSHGGVKLFLAILVAAGLVWAGWSAWRVGGEPAVAIDSAMPAIGRRTPIEIKARSSGRGLSEIVVELVQGERIERLGQRRFDAPPSWRLWGAGGAVDESVALEVGRETIEGLRDGPVVIRASARAAGTWLRRPDAVTTELSLPVRLQPPSVAVLSARHYVKQGGAEAVVYRVGETSVHDGVRSGDRWFPGYPLPGGGPTDRFALFAVPYDLADPSRIRLVATDDAGNEAETAFVDQFFARPLATDDIAVDDAFMARVVPEIMAQTPSLADRGSLLENYLQINGELRRQNAAEIDALAARSQPSFTWREPFQPLPGGQVMSSFADRRTYMYEGRPVDQQDHLGFDLASVAHAPVPAANEGTVVLARFFGIFGNAVILDHGYGLMSLYGHLSTIEVEEGQKVARGQVLGRSGQSGLAGGDHLHFTMLLHGLPVDPVEWWDAHWIGDRLAGKLGGALPFGPAGG